MSNNILTIYGKKHQTGTVESIKTCPECGCKDIRLTTMGVKSSRVPFIPDNKNLENILKKKLNVLLKEREAIECFKCGWIKYTNNAKRELRKEVEEIPNILIPRKGSMCLYLPFTTCVNSTILCRVACSAKKEIHPTDIDRQRVYDIITSYPVDVVANKIAKEVIEDGSLFHWFASGDFPNSNDLLYFILRILAYHLTDVGITQCGFTRSPEFYSIAHLDLHKQDYVRIFFTAEKFWDKEPSRWDIYEKYGGELVTFLAVPDYEKEHVRLYIFDETGEKYYYAGGCGSSSGWEHCMKYRQIYKEKFPHNCIGCYNKKHGCFTPGKVFRNYKVIKDK